MPELFHENLNSSLIPTKVASEISGYNADYLARLCREKKIEGTQIGRSWIINRSSLEAFVTEQEDRKRQRAEELSAARGKEYRKAQKPARTLTFAKTAERTADIRDVIVRSMTDGVTASRTHATAFARTARRTLHAHSGTSHHGYSPKLAALAVSLAVVAGSAYASTDTRVLSALSSVPNAAVRIAFHAAPSLERSSSFRITEADAPTHVAQTVPTVPSAHDVSRTVALVMPNANVAVLSSVRDLTDDARAPFAETNVAGVAAARIAFASDVAHHPFANIIRAYVLTGESFYNVGAHIANAYIAGISVTGDRTLARAATLRDGIERFPHLTNAILDGYANGIYAFNDAASKAPEATVLALYSLGDSLSSHVALVPALAEAGQERIAYNAGKTAHTGAGVLAAAVARPGKTPATSATPAVAAVGVATNPFTGLYAHAVATEGAILSLPMRAEDTMLGFAGYASSLMDGTEAPVVAASSTTGASQIAIAQESTPSAASALSANVISSLPHFVQHLIASVLHTTSTLAGAFFSSAFHTIAYLFPSGTVVAPTLTVLHTGPTETLALPIPTGVSHGGTSVAVTTTTTDNRTTVQNIINNYFPGAIVGGAFNDAVLAVVRPFVNDSIAASLKNNRGGGSSSVTTSTGGVNSDGATLTNVTISSGNATLSTITASNSSLGTASATTFTAGTTSLGTTTVNGDLNITGTITAGSLSVGSLSYSGAVVAPSFQATDTAATSSFTTLEATKGVFNTLTVGTDSFTSLLGTGLVNLGGFLSISTSSFSGAGSKLNADLLDGYDSSYLLANSFSTSSANAWLTSETTDALAEGSVNQYFTTARARAALSVSGTGLAYSTTTGAFSLTTVPIANGGTNAVSQSTNGVAYFDGTSLTTGTGLTYVGGKFGIGSTTPSNELSVNGSALISGGLTASSLTAGSITSTGSAQVGSLAIGSLTGFLKATAGVISTSLIDLSTDVSSTLPVSHGGTGSTSLTGLLKGNGTGSLLTAVSGVDYAPATVGSSILYANGSGGFSAVTVSTPLTFIGGTLGIQAANGSQSGYLSSSDWNTFNSKQAALAFAYPLVNTANTVNLAFGTTTANSWSSLQTFSAGINVGASTFTSLLGTGLSNVGGALTVATSSFSGSGSNFNADLLDGLDSTYLLANSFSTTSASYFLSQSAVAGYSTTSANYWLTTKTTDDLAQGTTNKYYSDTLARAAISSNATGLTYTAGSGILSLTAGYNIPLTASTTEWSTFYVTPSTRITAGTNLSWAGNTLNGPSDSYIHNLFSAATPLSYNAGSGAFTFSTSSISGSGSNFNADLLDGLDSTYFLANAFSTTSANYWKTQNNFYSTTSADFWLTGKSTTNLAEGTNLYYTDARADARINATTTIGTLTSAPNLGTVKTTLTGILKATSGVLSNAVAGTDYESPLTFTYPLQRTTNTISLAFGTTTANTWSSLQTFSAGINVGASTFTSLLGTGLSNVGGALTVATSSFSGSGSNFNADLLDGLDSTYFLANAFSTTSANYWKTQNNFYSTTSADFWLTGKSTTNLAEGTNLYYTASRVAGVIAGTTTDALAQGSVNKYYSDTLATANFVANLAATTSVNSITTLANLSLPLTQTTGTLAQGRGGTGITSYTAGDILYADNSGNLAVLPVGATGQVLKVQAGLPSWGIDQTVGGGGSDGIFATSSGKIYPLDTSNVLLVGTNATSTSNSIFEVNGIQYISSKLGIATTSPSAALSVAGNGLFSGTVTSGNIIDSGLTTNSLLYADASKQLSSATLGTGLSFTGGALSVSTSTISGSGSKFNADLLDGLDSTYFLANAFGTTSANYWLTTKSTTDLAEGSNLYYTDARADARINATTTIGTLTSAPNLGTVKTTLTGILKATSGVLSNAIAGTDYENPLTFTYPLQRTTNTISLAFGTTTANSWSALQQFNGNASTTQLSASGLIYAGNIINNGLTANSLTYANGSKQEASVTLGTGLSLTTGTLSISTSTFSGSGSNFNADLLDGQDGTYYLANAFSTTSAAYWKTQNNFYSTTSADFWLTGKSTTNLTEGTNLYYTTSRVAGVIAGTTTDALAQGSVNKYYSDTLARAAISSTATGLTYTSGTGVFSLTGGYTIPLTASTTDWNTAYLNRIASVSSPLSFTGNVLSIAQAGTGSDGYLSTTDWNSFNSRLSTTTLGLFDKGYFFSTTSASYFLSQNQGAGYSTTSANYWLTTKSTTNLAEGTNLYYTDARADARINATSTIGTLTSAPNLGTVKTTLTGILKATSGVLSNAVAGTDYESPLTFTYPLQRTTNTISLAFGTTTANAWSALQTFNSIQISGNTFTSLLGFGLSNVGGALTVSTTSFSGSGSNFNADFLDGYDSAAFLANGFSTTSADYWKTQRNFYSTTSADYWLTGKTTDNLAEGTTNLYWTNTRFDNRLSATTTLPNLTTLANLGTVKTSLTGILKATSGVLSNAVAGTDYENPLTFTYPLTRSTNTISLAFGTTTANTWSGLNTFNGGVVANALTLGALNGPLQANNGVVSATSSIGVRYGGTGLTSVPAYGQLLLGNGTGYTLTATSSLGLGASYFQQNGNAFGGLATLGTTDSNSLRIITAGIERARFDTSGSLLIGTTSNPNGSRVLVFGNGATTDFDIMGDPAVAGGLGDAAHFEAEGADFGVNGAQNSIALRYYGSLFPSGIISNLGISTGNRGVLDFGTASTSIIQTQSTTPILFGINDVEIMRLTSTGLGIGTTSPYAKLSVVGQTVSSYFTATTSTASTFPYASTTALTVSGGANALTIGSLSGLLKATSGAVSTAVSGTDYAPATTGSNILAGNGAGGFSAVSISSPLTFVGTTLGIQQADNTQPGYLSSTDWSTFNGKQDALTFSYPLINTANTVSLSFGTTTANSWSALQTFNGGVKVGSLSGVLYGNSGTVAAVSTSTPTLGTGLSYSGTLGSFVGGAAGTLSISTSSFSGAGSNFNADLLDGLDSTYFLNRANHTGTQLAATISDFSTTARGLFSSAATGLTYTSGTGVFSLTAGYNIPLTASTTDWNTAYLNRITLATYPLQISSNVLSLAFGTTTANSWSSLQTFNGGITTGGTVTLGSLTGVLHASSGVVSASNVNLASEVTGTLPVANGGTGSTTLSGLLKGNGTGGVQTAVAGTDYQAPGNYITALTGDVTASGPGSAVATLATVNSNVGSFGGSTAIPTFTVNAKGLITAAGSVAVIAPAGTLTGTTLASNVVSSSLTSVGTLSALTVSGNTTLANATSTNEFSGRLTANTAAFGQTGSTTVSSTGALTTPSLTVGSLSGVLKAASGVVSVATAGTDYQAPISLTTTGSSGAATFIGNTLNIPQYQAAGTYVTSISIASANGFTGSSSGGATPALTIGTSVTGLLKGNGTAISAATAGTDYENPLTFTYPLQRTTNTISLAFGTTTANSWSALQQFNGNASTTQLSASGLIYAGNIINNGLTANSLTYANGSKQEASVTLGTGLSLTTGTLSISTSTFSGSGSNFNADLLDGLDSTYFLNRANHTGTQLAATISDFSTTARGLFSSTATGLTYTSGTGVFSLTAGYNIPLTASTTDWNTAYLKRITSATYPLQISSNVLSLAFGTTTANSWSQLQTFSGGIAATYLGVAGAFFDGSFSAGTNGQILQTTGSIVQWVSTSTLGLGTGTVTSVNASGGTTGLSFSGGPITTSGSLTLAGTLAVANGGTGSTTLTGLLKGNGTGSVQTAVAGTDYQAPLTFSYPLVNTANTISLAFGTTTANSWSALQTFNGGVKIGSLSGVLYGNNGTVASVATSSATLGLGLSGALTTLGSSDSLSIATSSLFSGTTGQFPYFSGTNTLTATSSLFLATSGNIGIGTTSPLSQLTLDSSSAIGQLYINNTGASNNISINLARNNTVKALAGIVGTTNGIVTGSALDDFAFRTAGGNILFSTDAGSTAQLYLKNGGNVGIGTTTPAAKLALAGGNFLQSVTVAPVVAGSVSITSASNGIGTYVQGHYAYSVDAGSGFKLSVIDITVPTAPVVVGTVSDVTNLAGAFTVKVAGNYAYVTATTGGRLTVVDISNPSSPFVAGVLTNSALGGARGLYLSGRYAYVAGNTSGALAVVDITNPTAPTLAGSVTSAGNLDAADSVFVSGKYAYVTSTSNNKMAIVDITNPAAPTVAGSYASVTNISNPKEVWVSGRYAYVLGQGSNSLAVIDVSTPSSPTLTGVLFDGTNLNNPKDIFVAGRYAYITSNGGNRLTVVDISNPAAPFVASSLLDATNLNNPRGIFISGKYAYVSAGSKFTVVDIAGIDVPSANLGVANTEALSVYENGDIGNDLYVRNGLTVGTGGILSNGALSVLGNAGVNPFTVASSTGTNLLTLSQTGNLGIGTSSPFAALSIADSAGKYPFAIGSSTNPVFTVLPSGGVSVGTIAETIASSGFLNTRGDLFASGSLAAEGVIYTDSGLNLNGASILDSSANLLNLGGTIRSASGNGLSFQTNGASTARLVIDTSGNVGIGTSTPYAQLSLGGGDLVLGAATAGGTPGDLFLPKLGTSAGSFLAVDASGKVISTTTPSSSLTGTTGQVAYFSGTNTAVGTSTLFISTAGKVGIGTTVPSAFLHITGTQPAAGTSGTGAQPTLTVAGITGGDNNANSGFATGGAGSAISLTAGNGGAIIGTPTTGFGGAGGTIAITAGNGGAGGGTSAFAGAAGNVTITAGLAGNTSGGTGGSVTITAGGATGAGTLGGNIYISGGAGTSNPVGAGNIILGVPSSVAIARGFIGIGTTTPWGLLSVDPETSNLPSGAPEFVIGSSTATHLLLTAAGNLGLGTTSPYAQLSLGGGNLVLGAVTAGGTPGDLFLPKLGTTAGSFLAVDATGKVIATTTPSGGGGGLTGSTGQVAYFSGTNTAVGTSTLTIDTTGRVGVGTSSPSAQLDVWGSLNVATGSTPALTVNTTTGGVGINTATTNGTSKLIVNSPAVIGGTSNVQGSTLYVNGNGWFNSGLTANNSSTANATPLTVLNGIGPSTANVQTNLALNATNQAFSLVTYASISAFVTATSTGSESGDFAINTRNSGTVSEKFRVTAAGNVGIGTSTPWSGYKLAVNGTGLIHTTSNYNLTFDSSGISAVDDSGSLATFIATGGTATLQATADANVKSLAVGAVRLSTAAGEKLTVTSGGNVGIASTTPTSAFSVGVDSYFGGNVGIGSSSPTAALSLTAGATTAAKGINFGDGTANLYRSAAGVIKTDGSLNVGTGVITGLTPALVTSGGFTAFQNVDNAGLNAIAGSGTAISETVATGLRAVLNLGGVLTWAPNSASNSSIFNGLLVAPTVNAGGSNVGGTFYAARINPVLTSTTGLSSVYLFAAGVSNSDKFVINSTGLVGAGTTTPAGAQIVASNATLPQLLLTDTSLTNNQWGFRNAGGNLYIATTSPSTNATSTATAFTIASDGGLVAYNATGGSKGIGTINAQTVYANNVALTSDARYKTDIQPLDGSEGLGFIQSLAPVSYHWANPGMGTDINFGFLAQDVQKIAPQLVSVGNDKDHTLALNYIGLISPAIKAIQELAVQTSDLSLATTSLATQFASLSASVTTSLSNIQLPHALTATNVTADSITIAQGVSAGTLTTQSANVDGTVSAARYVVPLTANVFSFGSTTVSMHAPSEALASGGNVDLYKLAGYAAAGTDALASRTDLLAVKIDDLATRISALEALHAATTTASTTDISGTTDGAVGLALTSIEDALKSIGIIIHKGYLALDSLVTHQLFLVKGEDGTSSTGSQVIPAGATTLNVTNPLVHPSSKIFLTFTSSVDGSWYLSKKQEGSFTITLAKPQPADTEFDYFLLQTDPNAQVAAVDQANQPPAGSSEAPSAPASVSQDGGPVVSLNGAAAIQLPQGATWTDPGAHAVAADGTDLTSSITVAGTVDTSTAGLYTLTYNVVDATGKGGQASRVVSVLAPTSAPSGGTTVTDSSGTGGSTGGSTTGNTGGTTATTPTSGSTGTDTSTGTTVTQAPTGTAATTPSSSDAGTTASVPTGTTVSAAPDASPAS